MEKEKLLRLQKVALQHHVGAGKAASGGKASVMGGNVRRLQGRNGQGKDPLPDDDFQPDQAVPQGVIVPPGFGIGRGQMQAQRRLLQRRQGEGGGQMQAERRREIVAAFKGGAENAHGQQRGVRIQRIDTGDAVDRSGGKFDTPPQGEYFPQLGTRRKGHERC